MTTSDDEELIAWFTNRQLPTGHFRMASWSTTDDLANMVQLAIDKLHQGNPTARINLQLVKARLEAGSV